MEKHYLRCTACGEITDDIDIARQHADTQTTYPTLGQCHGNNEWEVIPESEAL
jgi:hypothetical protein